MQLNYKIFFLFLFLFSKGYAQDAELRIIAPHYEDKEVYLWIEDDYFSKHKEFYDQGVVLDEECVFTFSTDKILKIRIGIDYQYANMFLEPGASYTIAFPKHDKEKNRSMAWNTQVMLSFLELPEEDINSKIMNFNSDLDVFFSSLLIDEERSSPTSLDTNLASDSLFSLTPVPSLFSQRESLAEFNEYKETWSDTSKVDSSFYTSYKEYAGASIAFSLGEKREYLFERYLLEKPILYDNLEYADFFNSYFENFLQFYSYYPYSEKLSAAFASEDTKKAIADLIAGDSFTGDEQLQELVLIKALYDYGVTKSDKDSVIISNLDKVSNESIYPPHKKIAANYSYKLSKGSKNTPFPDFQYIRFTGDTTFLYESEGQLTYIQIFASWSSSSLAELELMNELYKRYNSKVRFVSLNIDPEIDTFNAFIKENRKFKWEFGWIGMHPETLEKLSVYSVPMFYLLDNDFKIIEWPALWPSTGIEKVFYDIELKEKEGKKFRFWENQVNKSKREE